MHRYRLSGWGLVGWTLTAGLPAFFAAAYLTMSPSPGRTIVTDGAFLFAVVLILATARVRIRVGDEVVIVVNHWRRYRLSTGEIQEIVSGTTAIPVTGAMVAYGQLRIVVRDRTVRVAASTGASRRRCRALCRDLQRVAPQAGVDVNEEAFPSLAALLSMRS